ncbi:MAG: hypothetical protein KAH38_10885 [Candidatus Hydrogenedentes bacterium]|nr:hypothetical protein [Candidatus Hydrogenedentota bacterium]
MKECKKKEKTLSKKSTLPVSHFPFIIVITYVALILGADTLAAYKVSWPFNWSILHCRLIFLWQFLDQSPPDWAKSVLLNRLDLFKLLFWFILPFLISLRTMKWSWFSPHKWKRNDWLFLGGLLVMESIAILSIKFIPTLHASYPGLSYLPVETRLTYSIVSLVWVLSWLPGWEFLHRYFLLHSALKHFPRYGWLLIPLSETLYHLQKDPIEAGGMALFSVLLTWWSVKRHNMLLPFLAHLYVEIALIVALAFYL